MLNAASFVVGFVVVFAMVFYGVGWLLRLFTQQINQAGVQQARVMKETVESVARVIRESVTTTTETVVNNTMRALVGDPSVKLEQPVIPPEGDPMHPSWMSWEDQQEMEDPRQAGIGDVEMFDRSHEGTSYLAPGESIIPGIPLPDMSAETAEF